MTEFQTVRGMRDLLPEKAMKKQKIIGICRSAFEKYGFEPLETPVVEEFELLAKKATGGEAIKEEIYYFKDKSERELGLRFDLTVPLARVVAQYGQELPSPFRRYQIQPVWRAENTQRGRYREFLQCDTDIFGVDDRSSDGETIALTVEIFKNLGFKNPIAIINDRALYKDIPYKAIVVIDKLEKIGKEGVIAEMIKKGFSKNEAEKILSKAINCKPNDDLKKIFAFLDNYGMKNNYQFKPTLARSFSYSTGTIWEIIVPEFLSGSLAGCERFDSLVSRFSNQNVPAVGFAIGFDRTVLAMEELGLFPELKTNSKIMVTIFNKDLLAKSQTITQLLRKNNINTELYPDSNVKLDKQLKYANKKGIPYVIIIGPEEVEKNIIKLKDMKTGEQKILSQEELLKFLC